jgi:Formin Homology 2 Domain/Subunit CCDC53 of WASH complex
MDPLAVGSRYGPTPIALKFLDTADLPKTIELSERQLQLLEARRKSRGLQNRDVSAPESHQALTSSRDDERRVSPPTKAKSSSGAGDGGNKSRKMTKDRPKGSQENEHLADLQQLLHATETAETVPTTWSESSSAVSDAASSPSAANDSETESEDLQHTAKQFYGQRLKATEKKLYDDSGATWSESRSEVSVSSSAVASTAPTTVISKPTQSQQSVQRQEPDDKGERSLSPTTQPVKESTQPKAVSPMTTTSVRDTKTASSQDSATLHTESEESIESVEPLHSRSESLADAEQHVRPVLSPARSRPPLSPIRTGRHDATRPPRHTPQRNPKFVTKLAKKKEQQKQQHVDDPSSENDRNQQRTIVRNLMYKSEGIQKSLMISSRMNKSSEGTVESEAIAKSSGRSKKGRMSWLNSASMFHRSPRSGSSGSSGSQGDRDVIKRVLERAQKNRAAAQNPRKGSYLKSASSRMKGLVSPKHPADRSGDTIDEISRGDSENEETITPQGSQTIRRRAWVGDTTEVAETMTAREGRSPKLDISRVASRAMDDLIEIEEMEDSDDDDDEEADVLSPRIMKARSVKSLPDIVKDDEIEIKISTSSDHEVSTPVRANNAHVDQKFEAIHEARKEFSKIEGKSTQNLSENALSDAYKSEPDGYPEFINALKCELSNSNSKLYDGFHAMFHHGSRQPQPLPTNAGALDLETKDTIATMRKHLTLNRDVDFVALSQLMSNNIAGDSKPQKVVVGQHLLQATRNGVDLVQIGSVQPANMRSVQSDFEQPNLDTSIFQAPPSPIGINPRRQDEEVETSLTQHNVRKSNVLPLTSAIQESTSTDSSTSFAKTQKVGSTDSVAPSDDSIFYDSTRELGKPAKQAQRGKSPAARSALPPVPSEKESIPWTSIKLRSVTETNKQGSTETDVPASWTRVKLRPVSKPNFEYNVSSTTESIESEGIHRIVLRTTPRSDSTDNKSFDLAIAPSASTELSGSDKKPIDLGGEDGKPIKLIESRGTEKTPIKLEDISKGTENNPIKLSKSVDSLDLNDGSIMVSLSSENGSSDVEMKLLISRQGMMKVEAIPGETRVNVVWRLDREEIQSALLDMSTFTVKLFVSSKGKEHKDLSFPSSHQCMLFANALHELTNGSKSGENSSTEEKPEPDDAIYVEQLSEDEQFVLEEFRQRKNRPFESKETARTLLADHLLTRTLGCDASNPPSIVNAGMTGPHSPLSEVSGVNSLISVEQLKKAETYQKMLKMRMPMEAVKHKMVKDQIDPKVIDFVVREHVPNAPATVALSPEDEMKTVTYRKMLNMMVPAEAVRHKMQKDGIEQHIVSAVLGEAQIGEQKLSLSSATHGLTVVEQAVAAAYEKMLKMKIPKEAVEHKMRKDGVNEKIISHVVGPPKRSNMSGKSLTDVEESIASSYRKLLKRSVPKESIRFKMVSEGVSEKIIADVLGEKTTSTGAMRGKSDGHGFKPGGFHWCPIPDDESIAGSVWSKAKPLSESGCEKPGAAIDITKHVERFQKRPEALAGEKKAVVKSGADSKEMAKLIDLNRANNVAITLKAFNEFSQRELSQIIEFIDPYGKIKGDRALFMKDLLPSTAEVKAIKSYTGSDDRLVTSEKWFKNILHVKRIEDKIQVMRTIETFKMDAVVLGKSYQLLNDVCNQVMDSDRLPDLLDMVRQIGNRMNEGRGDAAAGFKLDFLSRLAQTKGSDKKTTALDLVVMVFVERNQREALLLSADFPDCQEASRIQLSDLETDVRNLEASLRKCRNELGQLQKERDSAQSGRPPRPNVLEMESRSDTALEQPLTGPFPRASKNSAQTEAASPSRDLVKERCLSLATTLKDREEGTNGDAPCLGEVLNAVQKATKVEKSSLSPRASLLAAFADKNNHNVEFSLEASIRRIEKFVSEAIYVILPKLEAERNKAIDACKALASFFCESGGEKTASNLLKILGEFSANIDLALRKYDQQKKSEARRNTSKKRKSLTSSKPPAPEMSSTRQLSSSIDNKKPPAPEVSRIRADDVDEQGEKKSLVLMVNEMLKVAGDEQIRDFMRGVVYDNPDEKLKKIYQAERSLGLQKSSPSPRKDIMSAIKQRRQNNRDQNTLQALTELRAKLEEPLKDVLGETEAPCSTFDRPSKSRVAARWSSASKKQQSNSEDDLASNIYAVDSGVRRSGLTERWSRKYEKDSAWKNIDPYADENISIPMEATDSEILTADSIDIDDIQVQRKRCQSYMDRWASKTPVSEASTRDLDQESDIGAFQETMKKTKTRQRYISRWASKPSPTEDIEEN